MTPAFGISGSASHVDNAGLTISDGFETLLVPQGATSFAFTKPVSDGSGYAVAVTAQPTGEVCIVDNGTGTIKGAAIANVTIACNTLVTQPLALGVRPANDTKIYLPVTQVGTLATTINANLDSGSAGTVLRAVDVFPADMVGSHGFVFPEGQTSFSYRGITVTNVEVRRGYGGQAGGTTDFGNLGFAQVTFGVGAQATTASMPIFLAYRTEKDGAVVATKNSVIGINPSLAALTVPGSPTPSTLAPCTPQSTTTCGVASPFRYLSYAAGLDKGFVLSKVTFASCDETTFDNCPLSPALTLGIDAGTRAEYSTVALSSCTSIMVQGAGSEPACSQEIPSVTISSGSASFSGPAIFDTGSLTTRLVVPNGMSFPASLPDGTTVRIAPGPTFAYQFVTGSDFPTVVQVAAGDAGFTNSGIFFFAQNSFLVDYSQALEGWRAGGV